MATAPTHGKRRSLPHTTTTTSSTTTTTAAAAAAATTTTTTTTTSTSTSTSTTTTTTTMSLLSKDYTSVDLLVSAKDHRGKGVGSALDGSVQGFQRTDAWLFVDKRVAFLKPRTWEAQSSVVFSCVCDVFVWRW